jgi:hypothetical protein
MDTFSSHHLVASFWLMCNCHAAEQSWSFQKLQQHDLPCLHRGDEHWLVNSTVPLVMSQPVKLQTDALKMDILMVLAYRSKDAIAQQI